ncbi:hexosyltransferase [Plakobranchus ocellatus]|uniref:Hexosyltransferase n=1 Tax=Plakobranchus ocellatus TaxID=259542 RepID=A0AAV4CAR7_9GAST|nr:hexosyltransferase [Plakobranchus ocellatus]
MQLNQENNAESSGHHYCNFFPVGFWQFKLNLIYCKKWYSTETEFNSKTGHYYVLSYKHDKFYNSDFKEERRTLTPPHLANWDVYGFINHGILHVFRLPRLSINIPAISLSVRRVVQTALLELCTVRKSLNLAIRAQVVKRIY